MNVTVKVCGCTCLVVSLFMFYHKFGLILSMEIYSLEEDEGNELFITQESNNVVAEMDKSVDESDLFLGIDEMDFQSPCSSLLPDKTNYNPDYSDISDCEIGDESHLNDGRNR